jgi:hypothetical protein
MSQDQIIQQLVAAFKEEPRNKIIIDSSPLLQYTAEELQMEVTSAQLAEVLARYEDGEATEADESMVDAATSLCHQVANRCWGECESEEDDEWSEVEISTEWSDFDSDNPDDLFVVVYLD